MENTSSAHKMVAMSRAKSKIENKKQKQENRATKLHSSDLHTSVPASKLDVFNINTKRDERKNKTFNERTKINEKIIKIKGFLTQSGVLG